ncbi:MAG: 50S ribosomal protein L22 [Candidatus Marinimicrobia bacterium]|nr:50S ribosomal protein L22 [Candidatus Neomarinimicrobiota bacterium]|tara:strand:+ start:212 stop:562 length:351 start_codon:yes stop_codon:yes gene_type:complete
METTVRLKYIKQSPKKVRFVLNSVRGSNVKNAINKLEKLNKKAAFSILKALKSAISNLSNTFSEDSINENDFYIFEAYVDQGPVMKRFRPAAMGRATPILKRSSHLTLTLKKNSSN